MNGDPVGGERLQLAQVIGLRKAESRWLESCAVRLRKAHTTSDRFSGGGLPALATTREESK